MHLRLLTERDSAEATASVLIAILGAEILLLLLFEALYPWSNRPYEWYSYPGQRAFGPELAKALCWCNSFIAAYLWLAARPMRPQGRLVLLAWGATALLLQVAILRLVRAYASEPRLVIERVIYP
jgi:hypothetical protein